MISFYIPSEDKIYQTPENGIDYHIVYDKNVIGYLFNSEATINLWDLEPLGFTINPYTPGFPNNGRWCFPRGYIHADSDLEALDEDN